MLRILLVLLALISLNTKVYALTYYVDFNIGNDSNAGTKNSPWKTIPGTRNTADTSWQQTCWGAPGSCTIDVSHKVSGGTIFKLKRGTIHDINNGGRIVINSQYYQDASINNPIEFELDESWGTGDITFDGSGMHSRPALIEIKIDGVKIDGKYEYGIIVKNGERAGIQYKEHSDGSTTDDAVVQYAYFFNNGTICTENNECFTGQLHFRHSFGVSVSHISIEGNHNHINGIALGETNKYARDATMSNIIAFNHDGNDPPNDTGIGFTAENSQATFINCTSYNNLKGWDLGQGGTQGSVNITYKVINSTAYNNGWGINMNSAGQNILGYTGVVNFYLINNIVRDNVKYGSEIYAGPYNLYMVHNVYDNNGTKTATDKQKANLRVYPTNNDYNRIKAYLYNNIFYKSNGHSAITVSRFDSIGNDVPPDGTDYSLYSDYNAWVPRGTEDYFAKFSFFGGDDPNTNYPFSDVGKTSGNWYLWYSYNNTPPNHGNGHLHCDSNSVTTEPPFLDVINHNYTLISSFSGLDISNKVWYIPEMGIDRNGYSRTNWDMGAYENGNFTPPPGNGNPDAPKDLKILPQ